MKQIIACIFLFLLNDGLQAQHLFSITLLNELQEPVAGARAGIGAAVLPVSTDSSGLLRFEYSRSKFLFTVSHPAYETKVLQVNGTLPDTLILQRNAALLGELVVHAFERNRKAAEAPASITVISKNDLDKFEGNSFVSAMNTAAGVKMDERSPGSYRLSIRGNLLRSTFGVRNVKVYWNGIPFTDASGNTYFNLLSLQNIGSIEIIKGPSGSMYGSGTGGVILLSTVPVSPNKAKLIDVSLNAGSFGSVNTGISFTRQGMQASNIAYTHQQADGYREHTQMQRDVLHYYGRYTLHRKLKLTSNVFLADLKYETPGGLTANEQIVNPRQARPAAGAFAGAVSQNAHVHIKTIYTAIAADIIVGKRWNNITGVYASYSDYQNPTIRNYEMKLEDGIGGRTAFHYQNAGFDASFGAEVQTGDFHSNVFGNRNGSRDTLQLNARLRSAQQNIFAQANVSLPHKFVIGAGVSYNRYEYNFSRTSAISSGAAQSNFDPELVPRVTLQKQISRLHLHAAFSKGYSPPTIDEVFAGNDVFNQALMAEKGTNYELGLKGTLIKNKLWFDLAAYHFRLRNSITSRRDSAGGDFYTNAGTTKQKGLELSLHFLPINQTAGYIRLLKISGSLTAVDAVFRNYQQGNIKYDGNKLTGTAPNVLVLNADITTEKHWYANFNFNYTDHIPLNDTNSVFARSYTLSFLKIGYRIISVSKTEWEFFGTAQFAGSKHYSLGNDLNAAGNRYFNPAAPHQFSAGLRCRLHVQ